VQHSLTRVDNSAKAISLFSGGRWKTLRVALSLDLVDALFFKTIGVQEEMKRSVFRRVQDNLTAAQGANLLYQQVQTTSKISFKTKNGSRQPLLLGD